MALSRSIFNREEVLHVCTRFRRGFRWSGQAYEEWKWFRKEVTGSGDIIGGSKYNNGGFNSGRWDSRTMRDKYRAYFANATKSKG